MRRFPDSWTRVAIPAMTVGPITEERDGLLLWAQCGEATVEAAGAVFRVAPGRAVWVPAGVEHRTRTRAGAVVLPLLLHSPDPRLAAGGPREIGIPDGWTEWLLHQWDDNSGASGALPRAAPLLDLIAGATIPATDRPAERPGLPMPRSPEASGVAKRLLQSPASAWSLNGCAAEERVSAKTLQRQFLRETGLPFSTWRTRARVVAASRRLEEGRPVGEAGREAGFATSAGFTRAFRAHVGVPPREYAARRPDPGAPSPASDAARRRPPIPARSFWQKVGERHELMWVKSGTATLRIGARSWSLRRGDAVWIPAGAAHALTMDEDSLMLTIGTAPAHHRIAVDDLVVLAFPPEAEAVLLHSMASEFTLFRPRVAPGALASALLHEQLRAAADRRAAPPDAAAAIAAALRRDPADRRTLAQWAEQLRTTPEQLATALREQSGQPFPRWRSQIRMDVARDLLRAGDLPAQVSGRLGYASPGAFSRAFTRAHGIAPGAYRRREQG